MRPIGNPILCLQCRVRLAAGQINILVDKGKLRRLPSHVCVYTSYRLEWRSRGGTANAGTGHLSVPLDREIIFVLHLSAFIGCKNWFGFAPYKIMKSCNRASRDGVRPKLLPYTNFYLEVYTP